MKVKKFNRPSKERRALTRNQATDLIMKGKIETTVAKAKYLKSYVEKLITLGVRTYDKVVTVSKNYVDEKGNKTTREVINDAPEKLAARRAIKAKVYMVKEPRKEGEKKAQYIARMDNIKDPVVEHKTYKAIVDAQLRIIPGDKVNFDIKENKMFIFDDCGELLKVGDK